MTVRIPRWLVVVVVFALGVAGGGVGGYVLGRRSRHVQQVRLRQAGPDRLSQWQGREGQQWAVYQAQFFSGFYAGCDDVFLATDVRGAITDDSGHVWTVDDCKQAKPTIEDTNPPLTPPSDPANAGRTNGQNFACKAIILKSNSDLRGTTFPGAKLDISLGYCDKTYPEVF